MEDYKLARKKNAVDLIRAANRRLERAVKHMKQFDKSSAEMLTAIIDALQRLEKSWKS